MKFVEVSYEHYDRKKTEFIYDIYLKDEEIIHAKDASYFYEKPVHRMSMHGEI